MRHKCGRISRITPKLFAYGGVRNSLGELLLIRPHIGMATERRPEGGAP